MKHPLRQRAAVQIREAFPDAFKRHRLTSTECQRMRDFLDSAPVEVFLEVLPQVLLDALDNGSCFELRHLLDFVAPLDERTPLDTACLKRVFSEPQLADAIQIDDESHEAKKVRLRALSPEQWSAINSWRSVIERADTGPSQNPPPEGGGAARITP